MAITIRNMDYIRSLNSEQLPGIGARLHETITDILTAVGNLEQQVNGNASGQPSAPPSINGIQVSGANGFLHVALTDNNPVFRGIRYYVEHSDSPHFSNPQIVPLHDARNVTIPVGNQTRFVRAYSAYDSSGPSAPVYHGGASPIGVNGGGSNGGPAFLPSQSSGTGRPGQGPQGPGTIPFRSATGAQPTRGE